MVAVVVVVVEAAAAAAAAAGVELTRSDCIMRIRVPQFSLWMWKDAPNRHQQKGMTFDTPHSGFRVLQH